MQQDTLGLFRHDNFFAYQFEGLDLDGDAFEFEIESGDSSDIPPGLVFDRFTGWLTGFFPDQGATERDYSFAITIYKKDKQPSCKRTVSVFNDCDWKH